MEYYDFYDEERFDEAFEEIKDNVRETVKKEILEEITRLRKENSELKAIKKDFDSKVNEFKWDYENKKRELERKYQEDVKALKKAPLKELIELCQQSYYIVTRNWNKPPKCDKCNDQRQLVMIDAYGREHTCRCVCDVSVISGLEIEEKYINGISQISYRNGELIMFCGFEWRSTEEGGYIHGTYFDKDSIFYSYDEEKIKAKLNDRKHYTELYFINKEDAEKYLEYLKTRPELWKRNGE